ncbi:hypothetical protein GGS24DRAFT_97263 [Hypoxylon argillaceum]|nr:hypothetical protein GGS24DRAFT_97263 [Hypoxylon argillaceum]
MSSHLHILDLPVDVWVMVTQNLSVEELKPWRFTCRSLAALAAPRLFARLSISRLQSDQNKFEQVTRDPALASYVKEIIWHEFDSNRLEQFPHVKNPITKGQKVEFERGIGHMENLTTITVRMEEGWRRYEEKRKFLSPHLLYDKYGSKSLGVTIALMALYHPSCNVRTLNLATMVPVLGAGGQSLLARDTQAFQHLTSISICPFPRKKRYDMKDDIFIRCIQAAKQLENLQICFPRIMTSYSGWGIERWTMRFVRTLFNEAHWPCLVSFRMKRYPWLNLLDRPLSDIERSIFDIRDYKESLIPWIEECTTKAIANLGPRLRELQLHHCLVGYKLLKLLREKQAFPELKSIVLSHVDIGNRREFRVAPETVLAYLGMEITEAQFQNSLRPWFRLLTFHTTEDVIPKCWLCPSSFTLEGYDVEYGETWIRRMIQLMRTKRNVRRLEAFFS